MASLKPDTPIQGIEPSLDPWDPSGSVPKP